MRRRRPSYAYVRFPLRSFIRLRAVIQTLEHPFGKPRVIGSKSSSHDYDCIRHGLTALASPERGRRGRRRRRRRCPIFATSNAMLMMGVGVPPILRRLPPSAAAVKVGEASSSSFFCRRRRRRSARRRGRHRRRRLATYRHGAPPGLGAGKKLFFHKRIKMNNDFPTRTRGRTFSPHTRIKP